ncbi:MAG: GFA family protein [Pseudomonadota bacterium]
MGSAVVKGRCECGAVTFDVNEARDTITFCHCSQCRRTSGHYWASTRAAIADIIFAREDGLAWYASSEHARRGFCKFCGSSLFYQPRAADHLGIAAGCLDLPTGMIPGKHIFTADAGDYYQIPDDARHVPD